MARRKAATKRKILPDPLFRSEVIAKFMNTVMSCGKKSTAEKIVYGAFQQIAQKKFVTEKPSDNPKSKSGKVDIRLNENARMLAFEMFGKCLDLLKPTVEVRSRRVGGATYQVPVEVRPERRMALAMRWLVDSASLRSERGMVSRLACEILDSLEGKGGAIKKKEDVHRMAKANQAFAHYRW